MSKQFKVGDKVELLEGTRHIGDRQFGVAYEVIAVDIRGFGSEGRGLVTLGDKGENNNYSFGFDEVTLWNPQPTVIVGAIQAEPVEAEPVQDSSRGVFVGLELDSSECAENNVRVYDNVLSALKDANGSDREVFFVPYSTSRAGSPVWEAIR